MNTAFQFRRGSAAEWVLSNRILLAGEPGYETDTGKLKIGNGAIGWNGLPYLSTGSGGGANGLSAYQVAVANGYAGTEAQWLASLVGPTGPTGPQGPAGSGAVNPTVVTLIDAATIVVDASLGNDFRVTLGGNRTLDSPANPTNGQRILFHITQDATGSRTLTYNAIYSFGTAGAPILSTAVGALDLIAFVYNTTKAKWLFIGIEKGY